MSCWNKEELENMLEDVVNELDLSEEACAEHGPMGTAPAKLVRLVLKQKDDTIRYLRAGFKEITPSEEPEQVEGIEVCAGCREPTKSTRDCGCPCGTMMVRPLPVEPDCQHYQNNICTHADSTTCDDPENCPSLTKRDPHFQSYDPEEDYGRADSLEATRLICGTLNTQAFVIRSLEAEHKQLNDKWRTKLFDQARDMNRAAGAMILLLEKHGIEDAEIEWLDALIVEGAERDRLQAALDDARQHADKILEAVGTYLPCIIDFDDEGEPDLSDVPEWECDLYNSFTAFDEWYKAPAAHSTITPDGDNSVDKYSPDGEGGFEKVVDTTQYDDGSGTLAGSVSDDGN